jgi:hypothetical protein
MVNAAAFVVRLLERFKRSPPRRRVQSLAFVYSLELRLCSRSARLNQTCEAWQPPRCASIATARLMRRSDSSHFAPVLPKEAGVTRPSQLASHLTTTDSALWPPL